MGSAFSVAMVVASDLTNQLLKRYIKTGCLSQTTQDKPLARILREKQKAFSGGNQTISLPVQVAFMSDVSGFFAGYSEDDALVFTQGQNALRAEYNWFEHHAGLEITWSELKKDGISIVDSGAEREQPDAAGVRITTGVLKNRIEDFGESWARAFQLTMWLNGTQDAKAVPGLTSLLTDTSTTGTTGGLSRATYPAWRHRTLIGANKITASPTDQTLSKALRSEVRQLRRYGGKPDTILCGSSFYDALESEVTEKGVYTQEGFVNEGKTDMGVAQIRMRGVGKFEYDPTLDDLGLGKRAYFIDGRRVKLMPMSNEDNKVVHPERPYNAAVYFQSMTWTGALTVNQLNANGIYEVA